MNVNVDITNVWALVFTEGAETKMFDDKFIFSLFEFQVT